MNKCVVFVANRGYALTSSRTEIIQRFILNDWKVIVATSDDSESIKLINLGVIHELVEFHRGGFSIFSDIRAYRNLSKIYNKWKPDLIHHFHAKPVIFGTIAAHVTLGNMVSVVNTITGLGHAFIKGGILSKLSGLGYQLSLKYSILTIFQNSDDRSIFLNNNWVKPDKTKLILGSGVALDEYLYVDRSDHIGTPLIIIMFGRLLNQKGVSEFIKVAESIYFKFPDVKFIWAGEEDLIHPDSVKSSRFVNSKNIDYIGRVSNVFSVMSKADILLFPSYREGVPRAVMEASSTGLPVVAFDVPGVRESIQNNRTGYLVKDRDIDSLTERVIYLINNKGDRLSMGKLGRSFMEDNFDKKFIENEYINCYKSLGFNLK
jgi:glycosyltransferase involved in cell wall biosynthesis